MPDDPHDLTPDAVRALALAFGLAPTPEDLVEVTHRLNAMRETLAALGALPLDDVDPAPPAPEPR
jgi:hypothetical protein